MSRKSFVSLPLLMAAFASPAYAEQAQPVPTPPPPPSEADEPTAIDENEILVVARRLKGAVDVPQAPVATLTEEDIESYGADSIADLVADLSPQTTSGRGRGSGAPAILVNGQRISGFREIRNFPPEAIRRVEVLPEEVGLRYGFSADQRVINFILKDNFSSKTVEAEYSQPDRGGTSTTQGEASLLHIDGPRRLNLTINADHTSPLTEAERGVIQSQAAPTVPGDPDPGLYRTLIARSTDYGANATWSTGLGQSPNSGNLSLNAAISKNRTLSLSGLDTVVLTAPDGTTSALRTLDDPLQRRSDTLTVQGGATLNKPLGKWQLTATLDASHVDTTTLIDRRADTAALVASAAAGTLSITGALPALTPAGVDEAKTRTNTATSLATFIGRPLRLPAGEMTATVKFGYAWSSIASSDTRTSLGPTDLSRGDLSAGVNLGIPLTSRRENVLGAIGDITLNVSAGIDRLSDFGTLTDWSVGMSWSPTSRLNLGASYLVNQAAPSLGNLGNPQIANFNVPVYDFTRGQTSLVTVITGGNPLLVRETQRDIKLSANWQLPFLQNSRLVVEYFHNRSRNVTSSFPLLTPAIEAAFPDRVVRDPSGQLVSIDQRPVTLYSTNASRLRYGINLSGRLGKQPAGGRGGWGGGRGGGGAGGAGTDAGPPPGGGPGGFMGRGGRGGRGGRWNLALYHTVQFTNRVVVSPNGPVLDLIGGDALTGGGVARHSLELDAGGFYKGFGLRFNGTYSAPTHVRASGVPGSSDLRFGSLFVLNARLFADLGQQKALTDASSFFKGARLTVFAKNLFDQRQRVTDANGVVPLSYQPDRIDPLGRVIGIEFRKMF